MLGKGLAAVIVGVTGWGEVEVLSSELFSTVGSISGSFWVAIVVLVWGFDAPILSFARVTDLRV